MVRAFLDAIDERSTDEVFRRDQLELRNPLLNQIGQNRNQMLVVLVVQLLDAHDQQMPHFVNGLHILRLLRSTGQQMVGQNVLEHDEVEEAGVLALGTNLGT